MRQKVSKNSIEFDLHWLSILVHMRPALHVVCIPSEIPLEKTNFSSVSNQQLRIVSELGIRVCISFSFRCQESIWLGPEHLAPIPVGSCVPQSCSVWRALLPWNHSPPQMLTTFPPLLPQSYLSPEGRDSMRKPHFEHRVPRSLILHIVQLQVSVLVPIREADSGQLIIISSNYIATNSIWFSSMCLANLVSFS